MSDTPTTQATTGTTTQPPTPAPPWYQGLDAEHVGHIQARGWDKLDPTAVASEAVKAHVSATRMIGVPADQLLRLPKDQNDSDGWKGVWQRLGAPTDPKDYDFGDVQVGEATASLVDAIRGAAAGANVPKAMAAAVAKSVASWLTGQGEAYQTEVAGHVQAAETAIKQSWGPNYEAFNFVAKQGQAALTARLGERLAPQLDGAMELLTQRGFGELGRELMRVIGVGLGEDKFVAATSASGRPAMTREMAVARQAELVADREWAARYSRGDAAAKREMAALWAIIAGEG